MAIKNDQRPASRVVNDVDGLGLVPAANRVRISGRVIITAVMANEVEKTAHVLVSSMMSSDVEIVFLMEPEHARDFATKIIANAERVDAYKSGKITLDELKNMLTGNVT